MKEIFLCQTMLRAAKRRRISKPSAYKRRSVKSAYVPRKRRMGTQLMMAVAKRAVLKQAETKYNTFSAENVQLYHNGGGLTVTFTPVQQTVLLGVAQGNTQSTRVGDDVYASRFVMRLWLSNKLDRPNVSYRVAIVSVPLSEAVATNPTGLFKGSSGNKMLDFFDTDKYTILYEKLLGPMAGDYSLETGAANKEHSRFLRINIPLNKKIVYQADGGLLPKYQSNCWSLVIIAYDAYGTILSDNIASCAYVGRFYYKDP